MSVQVICGDARQLDQYALAPVDLVITSPPYNVGLKYDVYNDSKPQSDYLDMLCEVWRACYRVMPAGARICVNVPLSVGVNDSYSYFSALIWQTMLKAGFSPRKVIIWDKTRSSVGTDWGSWLSASNPNVRDQTETILVMHKDRPDLPIPKHASLVANGEQFMNLTSNLWTVASEGNRASRSKAHPAPFPVEIPSRLITLFGYRGCHVLDPFCGSGTTGVAASRLGCNATLVDISPAYCELARMRTAQQPLDLYAEAV